MYEDDEPIAIYRADIFEHFHRDPEPRVVLSIAVGDWTDGTNRADRCSATLEAWAEEDRVHMAFSDRAGSTWQELDVVSWQLTSAEAQAGPLREAFLRMADHIVYQDRRCAERCLAGRALKDCKPGFTSCKVGTCPGKKPSASGFGACASSEA